jgi:tetratricopeptide (TPR) repeat protein
LLALMVCLMAVALLAVAPAAAQEPPPATANETSVEPVLPEALAGIRGVRPGMTRDELLEVARGMLGVPAEYDSALAILSELARVDGNDLRTVALLAGAYEVKSQEAKRRPDPGADRESEVLLDRAVELYLYAGALAARLRQDRDAAELYSRVLHYRPTHPDALLGLARALAATQRQMMAIERYRDYLKTPLATGAATPTGRIRTYADTDSQAHLELGRVYRQSNSYNQAMASLQAADRINPQNPEILIELARLHRETRDYAKAAEFARRAVTRSPDDPAYRGTYATILLAQEEIRPALEHSRAAVELSKQMFRQRPDQPELLNDIQRYYRVYQEALAAHLSRQPDDINARLYLAQAMEEQGELGQLLNLHNALRMLTAAVPQEGDNLTLLVATARLQFLVGNLSEAAATCRRIVKLDPNNAVAADILEKLPAEVKGEPATRAAEP